MGTLARATQKTRARMPMLQPADEECGLYFARTGTSRSRLDDRPFRCVPAPVSPGGHAGLTRLRAGVAAGANTARFSPCKV